MADSEPDNSDYSFSHIGKELVNSLGLSMAVIGRDGKIHDTNEGWRNCQFGKKDPDPRKTNAPKYSVTPEDLGHVVGKTMGNYIEIWQQAAPVLGDDVSLQAVSIIREGINGAHPEGKKIEFQYKTEKGMGWMRMEVRPLGDDRESAVVFFRDVTRRRNQIDELRERQEEIREGQYSQLSAMSAMLKTVDPYTIGHQRHVAHFAQAIAREMGLSEEKGDGIWAASIVHDIGKVVVYPQILSKSGPLTAQEREMIETHTTEGSKILNLIKNTRWPLAQVALQHHERLDGSGYPNKAEGADILLEARIIAVADTIDAMGTRRPYRARISFKEIIKVLSEGKDRTFQAEAVDAAMHFLETEGNEFNTRYRDPSTPIPVRQSPPPQ